MPIWFLDSSVLMVVCCADLRSWDSSVLMVVRCADLVPVFSIFMVIRCADLFPVFFDVYGDTLCRSGPCILRYLW